MFSKGEVERLDKAAGVRTINITPNWPTLVRFFGADCERSLRGKTQKTVGVALMPGDYQGAAILALVRSGDPARPKLAVYAKHEGVWIRSRSEFSWSEVKRKAFVWGEIDIDAPRTDVWEYTDVSFGGTGDKGRPA
jgi:hypothetical protein